MKVYILLTQSVRYGGGSSIRSVTSSLEKARTWALRKDVESEYEHYKHVYKTHEVEK